MMTKSGQLHINKTEVKNIRLLLDHAKEDLSYGEGGSYNKEKGKSGELIFDEAAAKKANNAISCIEWILDHANFK